MRDEPRRQRWARVRRSLWQPPRPHGEAPRERVVGPLELFYDLVVVVLVAQAAHHLAGDLTWSGLGEFTAIFTLVWIAWANGSLHHELHGHDDARARSTFLLPSSRRPTGRAGRRSPSPPGCCSRCWPSCGCWPHAVTARNIAERAGCSSPARRSAPSRWPPPRCCLPAPASWPGA